MTSTPRRICEVCRRPLSEHDQYLVRFDGPRASAVHRSLCFPPARSSSERKPAARAAA